MNYQFFGTAGIASGILLFVIVVCMVLFIICDVSSSPWCYTATKVFFWTFVGCFLAILLFWFVTGIICGLNAIWGWGLVR